MNYEQRLLVLKMLSDELLDACVGNAEFDRAIWAAASSVPPTLDHKKVSYVQAPAVTTSVNEALAWGRQVLPVHHGDAIWEVLAKAMIVAENHAVEHPKMDLGKLLATALVIEIIHYDGDDLTLTGLEQAA